MAQALTNSATGFALVDELLAAQKWGGQTVSFGFPQSASQYGQNYAGNENVNGFQALTASQMEAVRGAMRLWGGIIDLKLTESAGAAADIRLGASSLPITAWSYKPGVMAESGDVWLGTSRSYFNNPGDGSYGKMTIMHEIGHALGLGHPHENIFSSLSGNFRADDGADNALCPCCGNGVRLVELPAAGAAMQAAGSAPAALAYGADAGANAIDAMAYSIMSYSSYAGDGRKGYTNGAWDYAQTPMLRDIAAVQHMYGANYTTQAGDTVYRWSAATGEKFIDGVGQGVPGGNKIFETIWDGGGRDTFDFSNYQSALKIDLAPGGWVNLSNGQLANLGAGQTAPGNIAMALLHDNDPRALIENAVGGAGNDAIKGNAADNVLIGGAGNDRLEGMDGNNILAGGTIGAELSYLGLRLADYISFTPPQIAGSDGDDVLIGGAGNDIFVAGTGQDVVYGGAGVNTLVIDARLDTIKITKNQADMVFSYGDSSVTATQINYLATKDGIFSMSPPPAAAAPSLSPGQADLALLYNAGLGRKIDASGLDYWSKVLANGGSLKDLAVGIIHADEFSRLFGNQDKMSDPELVQVLYRNVLAREGEKQGVDYWVNALQSHSSSRADVLMGFALSDENRAATAAHTSAAAEATGSAVNLVAVSQQHWLEMWG